MFQAVTNNLPDLVVFSRPRRRALSTPLSWSLISLPTVSSPVSALQSVCQRALVHFPLVHPHICPYRTIKSSHPLYSGVTIGFLSPNASHHARPQTTPKSGYCCNEPLSMQSSFRRSKCRYPVQGCITSTRLRPIQFSPPFHCGSFRRFQL